MKFWKLEGHAVSCLKGLYCGKEPVCNMTSSDWLSNGTCLTGATNGKVYVWAENRLEKAV